MTEGIEFLCSKVESVRRYKTLLYQFVVIVFGFIIPRLFITTYGSQIHGLTSSITNIMSYVMLLYAGLNTASVQSLYEPLGKGDYKRLNEILNAIRKYYIKTGYYFTVAVFIISFALPRIIKDLSGTTVFLHDACYGITKQSN